MFNMKIGKVNQIFDGTDRTTELIVDINGKKEKAIAYRRLTNELHIGDEVLLNTTAVDLNLGTGGYHFIVCNLSNITKESKSQGHIMKLRYTPLQVKVNTCEEQGSIYHSIFKEFESLDSMPILVGELHSIIAPLTVVLKNLNKNMKICYIMTDGGALPIDFSKTVNRLKQSNYIDKTITIGHAFGGDLECINIYNGLIAAKKVAKCDIAIVAMGPGIVGTDTPYGFTGIEQGKIIDAINDLGGMPIFIPRISFNDKRSRHYGISHHSLTILSKVVKTKALVGIPKFQFNKNTTIENQIEEYNINLKHDILFLEDDDIINIIKASDIPMSTMGRNVNDDLEYFLTIGVNAKLANKYLI